jgi:predicted DNA-binding protein (UPF0251 family)
MSFVPEQRTPTTPETDADALRVLDEEVGRLPERLRAAVVLCEINGLTRKDASARLGVAEGTVSSRLAAARKALADRLRARGVVVPATGLGVLLTRLDASATVPARLADAAARLGCGEAAPAAVTELVRGALTSMYLTKLMATVVLAVAAAGVAFVDRAAPAPRSAENPPQARATSLRPAAARAPLLPRAEDAEDKAVALVEKLGGTVTRDAKRPGKPVVGWSCGAHRPRTRI